jgi:hypothetical protein
MRQAVSDRSGEIVAVSPYLCLVEERLLVVVAVTAQGVSSLTD